MYIIVHPPQYLCRHSLVNKIILSMVTYCSTLSSSTLQGFIIRNYDGQIILQNSCVRVFIIKHYDFSLIWHWRTSMSNERKIIMLKYKDSYTTLFCPLIRWCTGWRQLTHILAVRHTHIHTCGLFVVFTQWCVGLALMASHVFSIQLSYIDKQ